MLNKQFVVTFAFTFIVFTLFMVGCSKPVAEEPPIIPQYEDEPMKDTDTAKKVDAPKKKKKTSTKNNDAVISSEVEQDTKKKDNNSSSKNTDQKNAVDLPGTINQKPNYNVTSPFNPNHPTLMGLTVDQSYKDMTKKFGKPFSSFVMDDENDPITVYEYPDFQVGFNNADKLIFVNVVTSHINPGLNGLRLGGTVKDAAKALGEPNSNSEYVLNYKTDKVILKLDIDPNTDEIISIKLFGN